MKLNNFENEKLIQFHLFPNLRSLTDLNKDPTPVFGVLSMTSNMVSFAVGVNCTVHLRTYNDNTGTIKLSVFSMKFNDSELIIEGVSIFEDF